MDIFQFLAALQGAMNAGYFTLMREVLTGTRIRLMLTQLGEEAFEDAKVALGALGVMTVGPHRWQFCPITAVALAAHREVFPTGNPYGANHLLGLDEELVAQIIVAADGDAPAACDARVQTLLAAVHVSSPLPLPFTS